jgi:hypothetical protein
MDGSKNLAKRLDFRSSRLRCGLALHQEPSKAKCTRLARALSVSLPFRPWRQVVQYRLAHEVMVRVLGGNYHSSTASHSCPCRRNRPSSIRLTTSGNSCATIGSRTASSNPTTTSSTIAASPGTAHPYALENHVHRDQRLGLPVMIIKTWYKGRLTSLVRLSYLAPGIVRALLAGRQPIELTPTRLMRLSKHFAPDHRPNTNSGSPTPVP